MVIEVGEYFLTSDNRLVRYKGEYLTDPHKGGYDDIFEVISEKPDRWGNYEELFSYEVDYKNLKKVPKNKIKEYIILYGKS